MSKAATSESAESADSPSETDRATIAAAGLMCQGLGEAIKGLARIGLIEEAKELSIQLKFTAKNLSWMMRSVCDRHAPSVDQQAGTSRFASNGKGK